MPSNVKTVVFFMKMIAVFGNKNIKLIGFAVDGFPKRSRNIQLKSSLFADTGFYSYVWDGQQGRKRIYFYIRLTESSLLKKKEEYERMLEQIEKDIAKLNKSFVIIADDSLVHQ